MNTLPSTTEHIEVSQMEHTSSADLIRRLKEVKEQNEITLPRIMDRMEENGDFLSMSTLRRVFANGSEAVNFDYENTLMPIARALLNVEDIPTSQVPDAKDIYALKAVIRLQGEELAKAHELKEHLEKRIDFLTSQIEIKDRRMDEKDEIIRRLMDKCL